MRSHILPGEIFYCYEKEFLYMKEFLKRYSYSAVHLFLVQIAVGMFGATLALAAGLADNFALRTGTSVFAIVFFLFLQFSAAWRVGAEDRLSADLGKGRKDLWVPVKIWLLANSLNFLLALLLSLSIWTDVPAFEVLGSIAVWVKFFVEGMYTGLLAVKVGGAPLNSYWFMHFITTLPSLVVVCAAYFCGTNNINFNGWFSPNAPTGKR